MGSESNLEAMTQIADNSWRPRIIVRYIAVM